MRAVRGEPLGSTTVRPRTLRTAAVMEFGSWPAALAAAGLELHGRHVKQRALCERERLEGPWEKERIREAILQRHARGLPLNWDAVARDDRELFSAAQKWFKRWSKALAFAGVSALSAIPTGVPQDPNRNREQ